LFFDPLGRPRFYGGAGLPVASNRKRRHMALHRQRADCRVVSPSHEPLENVLRPFTSRFQSDL
jgi:hypothetical protein